MTDLTNEEHERLRDDLAAYALDALEGPEAAALERHLEDCESCRVRLRWLRPAIDVLPASVEQLSPPESLRDELLETVRAEAGPRARTASRSRRLAAWPTLALRPAAGVAAVLLVAAGIGTGFLLRGSSDDSESTFVEARARAAVAEDASATLERQGDAAILHVSELPRLGRDDVYEVWVERGGATEPSSLFVLRSDRTAEAAVPGPLGGADSILVTREPRGGSPQPTRAPLLEVDLR
jgi:hypothetical protein